MLKNISGLFSIRSLEFVFSQNNVFKHACATPLTILMSNLEEELSGVEKRSKEKTKSSLEAVTRLSKIIKSVVADESSNNEEFGVLEAVNEALCLMRAKVESNCLSSNILIDKGLSLVGNKLYFQEAVTCILNNSIEAYENIEEKPVSFIVRVVNDCLRIDIIDCASGMNIFLQKLVLLGGITTKKNGMGLGLHFAKRTIEDVFFGKMIMKSTIGLGTRTTCIIPLEKPCSQTLLLS